MPKTRCTPLNQQILHRIGHLRAIGTQGRRLGVIIPCLLVILMINKCLADPTPKPDKPHGKIDISVMDYDFGFMPQKGVFSHTFVAKNTGDGVLNIVKIDPTCGCTTVPIKDAFLKPGEQTEIRVDFDSGKITGKVAKMVKVLSTDPLNGLIQLYIRGVVAREPETVTLTGPAISFTKIDVQKREVRIKNPSAKQRIILSVLPLSDDFIEASLSSNKLGPQQEAVLTLSLAKKPPLGEYSSSITIECKGEKTERISLPITGIGYAF